MSEVIANSDWKSHEHLKAWLDAYKYKPLQLGKQMASFKAYQEFTGGKSPEQIIKRVQKMKSIERGKELYRFFEWLKNDYVRKKANREVKIKRGVVKKGMAPSSAQSYVSSIRLFFRSNGLDVVMLHTPSAKPKIENKAKALYVGDISKLLQHTRKLRDKAIILTMFQSGMDLRTLLSLTYGKVKAGVEGSERPLVLHLQRGKTGVIFHTALGSNALDALKLYVEERRRNNELIDDDTLLFPLTKKGVEDMMKKTALRAGLVTKAELEKADMNPVRPYALRKSFSNILKNKSHLNNELVEYMMGHALPYNSAYNEPDPNDIRELYKSVEKLLSPSEGLVVENGGTVEELRQEFDQKLKNTLKDFLTYLDEMQVIHNVALPREFKLSDSKLEEKALREMHKEPLSQPLKDAGVAKASAEHFEAWLNKRYGREGSSK
jgi:integrase/recombinase XerD